MSNFRGARAAAWELLPALGVLSILGAVAAYSKGPVDFLVLGKPRKYQANQDFARFLNSREQRQTQKRIKKKVAAKLEEYNKLI